MIRAALIFLATVSAGANTASTSLDGGDSTGESAPRDIIKTQDGLWKFAKHGENNNAVFGCFAVDEDGGVLGRNDTKSHYGVFREASLKNKDVPFGIIKDPALINAIGIDNRRLPALITMHLDEDSAQMEFRKTQFFEDHTLYISEDPTRIFAYWKKQEGKYILKDMRPKQKNPNAPSQPNV